MPTRWVVTNVSFKFRQMLRAADDVIEALVVPYGSGRNQNAAELMRGERFPGVKNAAQCMFADGRDNHVHMISHYDKFAELITHPVKMHKTGLHDLSAARLGQNAPAVTRIQPAICRFSEDSVIFLALTGSVRSWIEV